jgi:hypothetical protein
MQSALELLLNLCWLAISALALFAWIDWRRNSSSLAAPRMLRGLLVVVCILALLFPVISISDDLSQTLSLAEGNRLQDVLKAPELRGIYSIAAILPMTLQLAPRSVSMTSNLGSEPTFVLHEIFWTSAIDNRPPPHSA